MANTLVSPGVQVTVVDESQYLPAATNSVPLFVIATAQNKLSADGSGIAPGTTVATENKLFLATSQRALLANYGNPNFYTTTNGTPINGYELNEYGLLAAYSALGITNQCYVLRAGIDLSALTASLTRPTGTPNNGSYWLNSTNSLWGIFQWNQASGEFTNQVPSVIVNTEYLNSGTTVPLQTYGSIGQYTVVATSITNPIYFKRGGPTTAQAGTSGAAYFGNLYNTWVLVGSDAWKTSFATIQGQNTPVSLTTGNTFTINGVTITVPSSPNNTVSGIANIINGPAVTGVYAANINGALNLYCDGTSASTNLAVTGGNGNGTSVTLTFAAQSSRPFAVGSTIAVSGSGVAGFNGSYTVTGCTTSSVTYADTNAGSIGAGAVVGQANGKIALTNVSGTALTTLGLTAGTYASPQYQASPSYTVPQWNTFSTSPAPTGSVWQKISNVNNGANIVMEQYSSTLGTYIVQNCPIYANDSQAIYGIDPSGGGVNIPAGTLFAHSTPFSNNQAGFQIFEYYTSGPTRISGSNTTQTFTSGNSFQLKATQPGTAITTTATVTLAGTTPAAFISAVSAAAVPYVSATISSTGAIVFTHSLGGDIYLTDITGTPLEDAGFTVAGYNGQATTTPFVRPSYTSTSNGAVSGMALSNFQSSPYFTYTASATAPNEDPTSGTYWYYSDPTQVDIMISNNGVWQGYQNVSVDARGYDLTQTNATGPIISATTPTTQTDIAQSPLVYGDLWVNTSNLEDYPLLYRWENVNGLPQWVQIANTDSTTSNGILFADARWAPNGTTNPVTDPLPPISGSVPGEYLLTSNYLDPDAPNALLYPNGILLWNTRRSGYNVKSFEVDAWNQQAWPTYNWVSTTNYTIGQYVQYAGLNYACITNNINQEPDVSPTYWALQDQFNTWNSATGARPDGSPYMGRQSQRQLIVESLRVAIDTNDTIREEQIVYNLIAVTGYPELAPNMVTLNNEINNVAFNVIDTPLRLPSDANSLITWATDNNGAGLPTGDGNLAAGDPYSATFYPSCQTTDLTGNLAVTYPSHMMIRTILRSDEVAYPWLAPAGTRRGIVDNALRIGYVNGITGAFIPLGVGQGIRDVLYTHNINPITYIPGVGIVNFGNKTLQATATALDRINVARLICFVRTRLQTIGKQYLFEPNDQITRTQIGNAITSLMQDLVAKRGVYDYLVVCDNTNNTPTTIDQNQLWVDIAIEPVKAVEFVYIPLRIENTGAIAAQTFA